MNTTFDTKYNLLWLIRNNVYTVTYFMMYLPYSNYFDAAFTAPV